MAKVNILYQELKYHIVDEATVYSEWLDTGRGLGRGSPLHIPVYRWDTGGPAELTAHRFHSRCAMGSLWRLWFSLSVLSLLELLLDVTALARLLLGFHWLCWGKLS